LVAALSGNLILFPAYLFTVSLASQRLFDALFLAGLQVKRMPLHFLDDVFLLYLAFEAAESIFQRLSLL
jgi:hypothetical protein